MSRFWVELALPAYSVFAVFVYFFHPGTLSAGGESIIESAFVWLLWVFVGALTGILAISALFLTFYLVYSPVYLAGQFSLLFDRTKWVDRREMRFYLGCFVLLCVLGGLAVANPTAAIVTFTILAGSAQVLWRILV